MTDPNTNDNLNTNDTSAQPDLPPRLTRRCRDCDKPFETRWYGLQRCQTCNMARLMAVSAYAGHESAWEERQRAAHTRLMAALEDAAARDARRTAFLWTLMRWTAGAAGVLLALKWVGQ